MKRLPHVNELVKLAQHTTQEALYKDAQKMEKVAAVTYTVPLADYLHKVAKSLRNTDFTSVTYADVQKFASSLLRR